jgi:hypothetical protein
MPDRKISRPSKTPVFLSMDPMNLGYAAEAFPGVQQAIDNYESQDGVGGKGKG